MRYATTVENVKSAFGVARQVAQRRQRMLFRHVVVGKTKVG